MQVGKIQRVFILDSNPSTLQQGQSIIENYCASAIVHGCLTVSEACRQIRHYSTLPIDLVLMDACLYGRDGRRFLDLANMYSRQCIYSPVLILTSSDNAKLDVHRHQESSSIADFVLTPMVPEFFQYLLEFHFDRECKNTVTSVGVNPHKPIF